MELKLSDKERDELVDLLDETIGDLGYEIAATENPEFRSGLRTRCAIFIGVRAQLQGFGPTMSGRETALSDIPIALVEELARPGD